MNLKTVFVYLYCLVFMFTMTHFALYYAGQRLSCLLDRMEKKKERTEKKKCKLLILFIEFSIYPLIFCNSIRSGNLFFDIEATLITISTDPSYSFSVTFKSYFQHYSYAFISQKQAMLVRQLEDEVVKAKTQASHTNPEVRYTEIDFANLLVVCFILLDFLRR